MIPRWEMGRQGTGYRKLVLGKGRLWDAHLIDYPPGVGIPEHVDTLPDRRHLRINAAIMRGGSQVVSRDVVLRLGQRLVVFWSDRPHAVMAGTARRIVLSIGLSLPGKSEP